MKGQVVVGSVTVSETDPLIWNDNTPALYIHRLVVARDLKGLNLGQLMIDRIEEIAVDRGKEVLRLDCWANNQRLKSYYERIGFARVNDVTFDEVPSLPLHYRNSTTTLFEKRLRTVIAVTGPGVTIQRESYESEPADVHGDGSV
jgi:hypothetical protein